MMEVSVYKSSLREYLYVYVPKAQGLTQVPPALLQQFGDPEAVLNMTLTPGKVLARADALAVLTALEDKGYYLQMPPVES